MRAYLVILFVFSSATVGRSADPEELLRDGIDNYQRALETTERGLRTERFERAERYFAKAIDSIAPPVKADLYVNLGNAALGADHLAGAVLAYRRALRVDPSNEKARQNLVHARSILPGWVPVPEDEMLAFGSFVGSMRQLRSADWQSLAAVMFFIAALCFAASRVGPAKLRWIAYPVLFGWVAVIVFIAIHGALRGGDSPEEAVIVIPDVIARSADSPGAPAKLTEPLPAGVEITVIEQRDQWVHAALSDGRDLWLRASEIELI
ncbi:hypothetical protein LOC67_01485 [Stieleria sp. JC731]|uniref:hypothetical protein n=1 Tax=Pirellulaceae TaxID=2691357 RepID=UPI001E5EB9F7|nr:hypothetical protein [Stieleria sp. JC731]MCC9599215.1 hypothetical protein [Stieleria sp. JC731]